LIAGVCGVLLFIVMFLPWFGFDVGGGEVAEDLGISVPEVSANFSAWESFDFIDLVLLLTVLVAVGLAIATAMAQTVSLPVAASALTAGLGILSTILVLYRILDPPGEADREFWVFVGLILAAGIAYGGWRSMQEEGTSFGAQADRIQDRVGGGPGEGPPPPPPPPPSGTGGPPPPGGPAA
jgi:hypothetical protein